MRRIKVRRYKASIRDRVYRRPANHSLHTKEFFVLHILGKIALPTMTVKGQATKEIYTQAVDFIRICIGPKLSHPYPTREAAEASFALQSNAHAKKMYRKLKGESWRASSSQF